MTGHGHFAAVVAALLFVFYPQIAIADEARQNETGVASVYSSKHAGGKTASGEEHKPEGMSAAHRTLPFGTLVRVTHEGNKRSVVVRIIDRGPFILARVIDLAPAAARELGFSGLARVTLSVLPKSAATALKN